MQKIQPLPFWYSLIGVTVYWIVVRLDQAQGLLHVTIQKPAPAAGEDTTPAHSISIEVR
jgi:hypothetical protein